MVKEFRRSSELLKNILLNLSSRRSSDSSTASAVREPTVPTAPAPHVETADLQAALQSHRKRKWADSPTNEVPSTACSPSVSQLFDAIASGDLARVKSLLEAGVDPNATNHSGYSALHWCTVQTPVPWYTIIELLESGCRVELKDKDGTQPVFIIPTLPRVQQQLVQDAIDYLKKTFPAEQMIQEEEDGAGGHQKAAGYILRRLQQGGNLRRGALNPLPPALMKNRSRDATDFMPVEDVSRTGVEITSIKVIWRDFSIISNFWSSSADG